MNNIIKFLAPSWYSTEGYDNRIDGQFCPDCAEQIKNRIFNLDKDPEPRFKCSVCGILPSLWFRRWKQMLLIETLTGACLVILLVFVVYYFH